MAKPVRSRQAAWVSASSGAEPEMKRRMFAHASRERRGVIEKTRVEGRDAHHRRRSRHRCEHRVRIEPGHEDHRRAGQERDIDRHEQPMGVKDGQRVNEPIGRGETPAVDQRQRVRREILMASASRPSSGRSCRRCRGSRPDRRLRARDRLELRRATRRSARRMFRRASTPRLSTARRPSLCASARTASSESGRQTVSAGSASPRKYSSSASV